MEHRKLIEQLQLRETDLLKELTAIRTLISVYNKDDIIEEKVIKNHGQDVGDGNKDIVPKGKMSWESYALYILRKMGGKAKASAITTVAIEANPNIDKKTIESAIRSKLSIKYREDVIEAIKGVSKKEGYTYVLDDNVEIRTK